GEKAGQIHGRSVENLHVRPAALLRARDNPDGSTAAEGARGHVDPTGEARVVGEETRQQRKVLAAEDLDVRAAAGAGPGDDVGEAVAVDVAHGHVDAAAEAGVVGEEGADEGAGLAVDDLEVRPAAGPGAGDDAGGAAALD